MPPTTRALLLTDVVDSTKLSELLGDARMAQVWSAHDDLARDLLVEHGGREIDKTDGFLLLFERATDAASYALAYHRALSTLDPPLRARVGLHVGEVILTENSAADVALGAKPVEVDGFAKPTGARIMALATGGQTLLSDSARSVLGEPADGCELRSHGHYRLKGVAEPMEIFEFGVPGESPFAPPADDPKAYRVVRSGDLWKPAREIKHSLPGERDAFVGRSADLHALATRLDDGERLVTVLGMGGTGKTRFVRRYGWSWLGDWPGGVYFCDLSEARSLDGIAVAVAGAMDVPLGKDDPIVQLGHAIAGRGKCLVILDNFEQVTEHAGATVGKWLERAKHASVVVTSRELLAIPGEHVLSLGPLPTDGAGVELFVVRAQARKAGFALTPSNEKTVQEIVTLLDGLPLAIELAAARSVMLSPEQLLARLKDRFQILVGARGVQARQTTLRAAIDWSWTLLAPWEQAALAQASVFVGGFTLEAAESVLDLSEWPEAPMALDVVQSLVDKSLFRTWTPGADRRLAIEEPYFGMYVSIHEYAGEKLRTDGALPGRASGPVAEAAAFERHGSCYAQLGSEEAVEALDTHGGVARRQALVLELENLIAACRRAAGRGDGTVAVATFVASASVLGLTGPFLLAVELGKQVLELGALSPAARGRSLRILGDGLVPAGRMDEARRRLEEALVIARVVGHRRSEGNCLGSLGILHWSQGRMDEALGHYQEALAIHREVGNRSGEGSVVSNLGIVHHNQGRPEEALRHFEEALAIVREVGNRSFEGRMLGNLGNLHAQQGRLEDALPCYEKALAIHREVGNRRAEGSVLGNVGILHLEQGRMEEALRQYQEALVIHREVGNRSGEGVVLGNLGSLLTDSGRMDEALRHYQEALVIHREVGNRRVEGNVLLSLGSLHADQGRMEEALRHYQEALVIQREVGDRRGESRGLGGLGMLHAEQGRLEEALRHYEEALAIARDVGDRGGEGIVLGDLGLLHAKQGRTEEALWHCQESLAIARDVGDRRGEGITLGNLGNLHADQGRMNEARAALNAGEALLRAAADPVGLGRLLCHRASLEHVEGRGDAAHAALAEAESLAAQAGAGPESELVKKIAKTRTLLDGDPAPPAG